MQIGISLFIGVLLSGWFILFFLLEYSNERKVYGSRKKIHLERRKCEVCSAVYFISLFFEFWRCPLCGSINKEK